MPSDAFLIQDGKEFGPFSPSQLKALADAGRIRPDDLIRKGTDGTPIPARNIAGLIAAFGAADRESTPQKSVKPADSSWIGEILVPDDETAPVARVPPKLPPRAEMPVAAAESKPSWLTTERVPPHFDPYHVWLGIPKGKRPPTHYQLLRIASDEQADEVIETAAERQAEYVRKCRIGEYAKFADRLLYEIEEARLCLLKPQLRRDYDERLAEGKRKPRKKRVLPPPGRPVGEGNEIATTYFKIVAILTAAFLLTAVVSFMLPWQRVVFSKSKADTADLAAPIAAAVAANAPQRPNPPNNKLAMQKFNGSFLTAPFGEAAVAKARTASATNFGAPAKTVAAIGMEFELIPPGRFQMGSVETEAEMQKEFGHGPDKDTFARERPPHFVTIGRPFYLGKYEVTVGQFRSFVEDTGYTTEAEQNDRGQGRTGGAGGKSIDVRKGFTWRSWGSDQTDDSPVVNVSWNDAMAFCDWLGKKDGRKYRLPSEAEWEFACRAGTTTWYYSGNDRKNLSTIANLGGDADGWAQTSPVGKFRPNNFGLYDMIGNVWEWCADRYDAAYYANSPENDPPGPAGGGPKVIRGGSWNSGPVCRASRRNLAKPSDALTYLGFRVACDVSPKPAFSNETVARLPRVEKTRTKPPSKDLHHELEQSLPGKYRIELTNTRTGQTDSSRTAELHADRTVTTSEGPTGTWTLNGEQLVVSINNPDVDIQPLTKGDDGFFAGTLTDKSNGNTFRERLVPTVEENSARRSQEADDHASTQPAPLPERRLFDGKTLKGWTGRLRYWKVLKGCLVGASPKSLRGGSELETTETFENFVLKAKVLLVRGNSGINFRGYQADIVQDHFGLLLWRGERFEPAQEQQAALKKAIRKNDWTEFVITANGDHITLNINGIAALDIHHDGSRSGNISLELFGPTQVAFKDITLQPLP